MKSHLHLPREKSGGFSLVEIMVAMMIGLLGSIVIFQVFSASEKQKRTTVGGGDAQQNGAIGLFGIEQDARMAGFGLNNPALIGCPIRWYVQGSPDRGTNAGDPPLTLAPVVIANGTAGAADTITVTYGNSDLAGMPGRLTQAMVNPTEAYKVDNRFGYKAIDLANNYPGDMVVAVETGKDCTLSQVTDVPGGGSLDNVVHNSGVSIYNPAAGLGVIYGVGASLINLGPAPTVNVYSIQNNSLALQRLLVSTAVNPVVDGIVQLQARYGRDTTATADGVIDVWDNTTPAAAADWARVLAVRIVLVSRSAVREEAGTAAAACTTTAALPQWIADPIANTAESIDVSIGNADWRCYRYKTFQTSAPLRNMIWRPL